MEQILLLEDDESINKGISFKLQKEGYSVVPCRTVAEAEAAFCREEFQLMICDVALPDGSGLEFVRRIREGSSLHIIFLTALDQEIDQVMGYEAGGDDYITKPFKLGELCSRIRALLRRSTGRKAEEGILRSGDVTVNLTEGRVTLRGEHVECTGAEYRLLCLFLANSGKVLTRSVILDKLWDGAGNFVDDNTLSVYVRRLREKLERDPSAPEYLKTVRGLGYQWQA